MKQPLELNGDFQYALDLIERTDKSVFITGRAGTGKSTLLRLFRRTTRKKYVVLAPTGIAALNVGGQTIHSFFRFPPKPIPRTQLRKIYPMRKLYKRLEVLIIDEVSMVRADMIDNIDHFLRLNRDDRRPFGGVQVVFFGDLFQLPPIVATDVERHLMDLNYDSPYFFSAEVFQQSSLELEMLELRKVYRQKERHFLRLLETVRLNRADYDDLADLNVRYDPNAEPGNYTITISARNAQVKQTNRRELDRLDAGSFLFPAEIEGDFNPLLYPTESMLTLKQGAQVMFVKNDSEGEFVNGTIGKVMELGETLIRVKTLDDERTIEVAPAEWQIQRYGLSKENPDEIVSEVVGTFTQYPLKLAWAVTIHKSQGQTFDRVIIDLGRGAFEHGQTYVALSRCRTLDGITLRQKLRLSDIQVDERVVEFYESNFW